MTLNAFKKNPNPFTSVAVADLRVILYVNSNYLNYYYRDKHEAKCPC